MTSRTHTPGTHADIHADIRDHQYAILQTRIERVPPHFRAPHCTEPDGCPRPATLLTFAVSDLTSTGEDAAFRFARDSRGDIARIPVCDEHRTEASHDLYFLLTGRTRPDGIRAFDIPGQHLHWL